VADPHATHDPEVVASLLDRDLLPAERARAARQVAGCADCAALHQGLLDLSVATRTLPVPARTRDFRLTEADAARLREPVAATARLTGEMHDPNDTRGHAAHDTILVASLADRTIVAADRERADALVSTCRLCAGLFTDLVAIRDATIAMPTPPRATDYQLTPADAIRLRPRGWRRVVTAFGSARDGFSRPLAVGLTTLGLAGLLVATVPSVIPSLGSSAAGQSSERLTPDLDGSTGAGSAAATGATDIQAGNGAEATGGAPVLAPGDNTNAAAAPTDTVVRPAASPETALGLGDGATGSQGTGKSSDRTGAAGTTIADDTSGLSTLVVLSGALLIVGLGLFALRWSARRFGD
jgi:hypothetical protein